nr:hypothetical protein [Actinomadura decatromicini]
MGEQQRHAQEGGAGKQDGAEQHQRRDDRPQQHPEDQGDRQQGERDDSQGVVKRGIPIVR